MHTVDSPSQWSVARVGAWLKTTGLAQYVAAFADNDIDGELLGSLTNELSKELVPSLGHRMKLLKARDVLFRPSQG